MMTTLTIATVLIAIFTAGAAYAAYLAAIATKKSSEAEIVHGFMKEYELARSALMKLGEWYTKNSELCTKVNDIINENSNNKKDLEDDDYDISEEIDISRRVVKYYFWRAYQLYSKKYVSKDSYKMIAEVSGMELLKPAAWTIDVIVSLKIYRDSSSDGSISERHIAEIKKNTAWYDEAMAHVSRSFMRPLPTK